MMYFWRRIGAFVIDLSVISMLLQIMYSFIAPIVALTYSNLLVDLMKVAFYLLVCVLVSVGYNLMCYRFFKFPLGKLLMNIKVLDESGERVTQKRILIREFNKYIYIYATLGLYVPFQFIMNVVKKKQTFHDRQGDTHIFM